MISFLVEFRNQSVDEVDFHRLLEVPGETVREKILNLQEMMKPLDQMELPLKHHFAPGTCGREILLPKGSLVIGKIHRHAHLNIISKGHVTVLTEDGIIEMKGITTFCSKVGTKRVVYAHEDTIWTTIHLTDKTDLAEIEDEIIAPTYEDLESATITVEPMSELQDMWGV